MTIKTMSFSAFIAAMLAGGAMAAPVTPTFGTFGDLSDAGIDTEFAGDGIPDDDVAYDTFIDDQGNSLTLGLTITPRYSDAPTPANDGAGTFTVQPGLATPAGSSLEGTLWNFSFYAGLTPSEGSELTVTDIGLELLYDLDAATGTDINDLGSINVAGFLNSTATVVEGSQNLAFNYLSSGIPGFNTPGLNTFSPNSGEYSFLLRANTFGSETAANVAVQADVAPIPLPAGLPLLLAGLGSLAFLRRRASV